MGKYKFINGVMVKNEPLVPSAPPKLEIITNQDDLMEASEDYNNKFKTDMIIPQNTVNAIEYCSNDQNTLQRLELLFSTYEVPIGLLSRLLILKNYDIQIVLDDSGSMGAKTDSYVKDYKSIFMKYLANGQNPNSQLSRWEEEEDRLHLMMQFFI